MTRIPIATITAPKAECIPFGCGACCQPVLLAYTQEQVRNMVPFESHLPPRGPGEVRPDKRTRRWILRELVPIPWSEAERLRPDLKGKRPSTRLADGSYSTGSHAYLCSNFDEERRCCGAYDDRPPTCRAWPPEDGGRPPEGMEPGLPPTCGYWPDYDRQPEPLPAEWPQPTDHQRRALDRAARSNRKNPR